MPPRPPRSPSRARTARPSSPTARWADSGMRCGTRTAGCRARLARVDRRVGKGEQHVRARAIGSTPQAARKGATGTAAPCTLRRRAPRRTFRRAACRRGIEEEPDGSRGQELAQPRACASVGNSGGTRARPARSASGRQGNARPVTRGSRTRKRWRADRGHDDDPAARLRERGSSAVRRAASWNTSTGTPALWSDQRLREPRESLA